MDSTCTIRELRDMMSAFVAERQWQKFHVPNQIASSIAIEAAELLEVFQWLPADEVLKRVDSDSQFRERLSDEIADVILYICSLANATGIDICTATKDKLEKNKRKYPVEVFKGLNSWSDRVSE